jgi:uncharacterized protein (TIGR02145 family)/uncharacterized repeat protein (TIGR02543 family)
MVASNCSKQTVGGRACVFFAVLAALFLAGCGFKLEINADPQDGGTVTPSGTVKYKSGAIAEVTATANDGYVFAGWSGASTAAGPSVTVTMGADQALTANFLRVGVSPGDGGTVAATYDDEGGFVEASPNDGYVFVGWSGALDTVLPKVSIPAGSDQELIANFVPGVVDSRDGNVYHAVKIGGTTWMTTNLNFKTGNSWCYGNNESNCRMYGRLYDLNTARRACPEGWRLPDTADWNNLFRTVGGKLNTDNCCEIICVLHWDDAGGKLKSKTGWKGKGNGTDDFGFSALPGGGRYRVLGSRPFRGLGDEGAWWISGASWPAIIRSDNNVTVYEEGDPMFGGASDGLSVRCVKE